VERMSSASVEPRFTMLETIREYAQEQLAASGNQADAQLRHSLYFLTLAERAKAKIDGPDQAIWLTRLDAEQDNLRAVLERAIANGDADVALRLGAALWRFWGQRGLLSEGRAALEGALAIDGNADPSVRAAATYHLGNLALDLNEFSAANRHFLESLDLWRQLADQDGIASSLNGLGLVELYTGDYTSALKHFEEALAIWSMLGDRPGIAMSHHNLGRLAAAEGQYELARFHHEHALNLRRQLGNTNGVAYSYWALAVVALYEGDGKNAESLLQESIRVFRELGDRQGEAYAIHGLARVALRKGEDREALRQLREVLLLRESLGERNEVIEGLEDIATAATKCGQAERAVRLLGAASSLRDAISLAPWEAERAAQEQTTATARLALTNSAFKAAWNAGRILTRAQAIAEALALTHEFAAIPLRAAPVDLTRREQEVLALLSQRMTDPEIAERLFISTKTASNHVANILTKLGATNRREAAAIAVKHALI